MTLLVSVSGTEDDDIDAELRTNAVLSYVQLLSKPDLPDIVIKIICWVIKKNPPPL